MTITQAAIASTQTIQQVQLNLNNILKAQNANTLGTVSLVKYAGGPAIAKLVNWPMFNSANIANTSTLTYVPLYSLLFQSPSAGGNNGLYRLTKEAIDARDTPDATVHASLLVSGYNYVNGVGSIQYTGITSFTDVTITHVVAGASTPLTVAVVGHAITVNIATSAGSAATSTMAQIAAAVTAAPAAAALVTAVAGGTTTTVAAALTATLLSGVLYQADLGTTGGNSITVRHVTAGANTALTVSLSTLAITVNLATNASSVATSTVAQVVAAINGNTAIAALVTAFATGTGTDLANAKAVTNLAGGAVQPTVKSQFDAYAIYNKRTHSKNSLVAPSLTPDAVLISMTHATLLGL